MERLWPDLKGKRVVLDAASSWTYDDGYTEEDDEWYPTRKLRKSSGNGERGLRPGDVVIVKSMEYHDRHGC